MPAQPEALVPPVAKSYSALSPPSPAICFHLRPDSERNRQLSLTLNHMSLTIKRSLITIAILLALTVGLAAFFIKRPQCHQLSPRDIATVLQGLSKQKLSLYNSSDNAYSPDNCYYAVDVLIGDAGVAAQLPTNDPVTGTWLLDTRDLRSYQIATSYIDYANVLDVWLSSTRLRLRSDTGDVSAVYDAGTHSVTSREVDSLMLRFTKLSTDRLVTPSPPNAAADNRRSEARDTNNGFFFYPISCLKPGAPLSLLVAGYKTFEIQYIGPLMVSIDGQPYTLSVMHGIEIDL